MKKIALLASLMAVASVSSAWAASSGTVGITGTVPAIYEMTLSNAAGTVPISAAITGAGTAILASADYTVSGSTFTGTSNTDNWQITATVSSTGADNAVANKLSHATINTAATTTGFDNQITVSAVKVDSNTLPYTTATAGELLNLSGVDIALTLSSTNPLIAGSYTGDVTLAIAAE